MSSNLVIVAIPDENDRVWRVSSEKVPHLTLLYLGDANQVSNLDKIVQFVEHAADTMLRQFYLTVDRRDKLGADDADVLFFRKGYDTKAIRDFRANLLKDPNIKTAYDAAQQFDGPWIPHLTLGYPTAPAKEVPEGDRFYDVSFNKIAVWPEDYNGPEFLLKDYWDEVEQLGDNSMDIAWSGTGREVVTEVLEHHGVKGMKWGVRKEESAGGSNNQALKVAFLGSAAVLSPSLRKNVSNDTALKVGLFGYYSLLSPTVRQDLQQASKKVDLQKADKQWDKAIKSGEAHVAIHNKTAEHFNAGLPAVNAKHPKDFSADTKNFDDPATYGPKYKAYMKDISQLSADSLTKAANELHMANPSGTKTVEVHPEGPYGGFSMHVKELHHADSSSATLDIHVTYQRDADGLVTGFTIDGAPAMAQSMIDGEAFVDELMHYGIKGMKWGVRKEQVSSGAKSAGRAVKTGAKRASRAIGDATFEGNVERGTAREHVAGVARADFLKHDLPAIKAKPQYQEARKLKNRLRNPKDPATKAYRKEVKDAYIQRLEKTANSMHNASGTRQYTIRERGIDLPAQGGDLPTSKYMWDVSSRKIQHAADPLDGTITLEVIMDEDGFITDLQIVPATDSMAQSAMTGEVFVEGLLHGASDDILAHYGVKGMRWGFRNSDRPAPKAVSPKATSLVPHGANRKTKVEVAGGQNHHASEDALKVAQHRAKLAKSGPAALSNQELREVAQRLQLEQQVAQLQRSPAQKFIKGLLGQQGNQAANQVVGKQIKKKLVTAALI